MSALEDADRIQLVSVHIMPIYQGRRKETHTVGLINTPRLLRHLLPFLLRPYRLITRSQSYTAGAIRTINTRTRTIPRADGGLRNGGNGLGLDSHTLLLAVGLSRLRRRQLGMALVTSRRDGCRFRWSGDRSGRGRWWRRYISLVRFVAFSSAIAPAFRWRRIRTVGFGGFV